MDLFAARAIHGSVAGAGPRLGRHRRLEAVLETSIATKRHTKPHAILLLRCEHTLNTSKTSQKRHATSIKNLSVENARDSAILRVSRVDSNLGEGYGSHAAENQHHLMECREFVRQNRHSIMHRNSE